MKCGAVLNGLTRPCHLESGHQGQHESVALARDENPNYAARDVLVRWYVAGAKAADRDYLMSSERA